MLAASYSFSTGGLAAAFLTCTGAFGAGLSASSHSLPSREAVSSEQDTIAPVRAFRNLGMR
jgi:hypothetical protein